MNKLLAMIFALALTTAATACGGSAPAATPMAAAPVEVEPAQPQQDEHGDMPAELVAFHDVLRPLWHDETPERQAKTCAQVGELDAKAGPLTGVEVAADKKEVWTSAVAQLEASIDELGAACTGGGDFMASFTKVHEGFHGLLEIAGGGHEEHGEEH
ncbi:MAG TPA: hypothetical protein VMZ28_23705 [Kofleriaceae bacterium]|nr:hypothetical protein [Kofleriaceae bacterium]